MQAQIYRRFALVAATVLLAIPATNVLASSAPRSVLLKPAGGKLEKRLTVTGLNQDKARITILSAKGRKESAVVYGGDLRLALAETGVIPSGGTNPAP